ncbi:MAG: hypothetical protein C0408_00255 [Odoribacter sp.]|nr:hypothetical protein [Odoribacter sp.]
MKKQVKNIFILVFLGALMWGCTKNDGILNNESLKLVVNQSAMNLNSAMDAISSSKAFSILTVSDGTLKSATIADSVYRVYIPLDLIKGVYDYKPVPKTDRWGWSLMKYFNKTADNSKMIVRMPLKKVQNPRSLRFYSPADSALTNNFSIAVSDYHNNYNSYWDYDYFLASEISIDNVVAGNLNIKSIVKPKYVIDYASQYVFSGSYTASYRYLSGDTTVSSFTITGDNKVLYEEKLLTIKKDSVWFSREHQYILSIGDVQIIRKSGIGKAEVLVNGVLQPNAIVEIVDREEDSEASVCKKRDIRITFEDGTTTTISALIGKSIDNIKTLFNSLHQVYFAAYVVDWIAYDVYYHRN